MDDHDNRAPTYAGTVAFTSSDGAATLPGTTGLTGGQGTFSATLRTQGDRTITAIDTLNGSITGTSGTIAVAPSAAQSISLALSPTSITANQAATTTATVTIKDGSNNGLQGKTVTIATNGDVTVGSVTDHHDGTYTAIITASRTAGSTLVTATDVTDAGITATATLTEVAGSATQLVVLLPGETIAAGTGVKSWTSSAYVATAGTAFNITVRALDQYWNLATTATPTVTFSSRIAGSSETTAVLPGATALVGGTRTVSVTPKAATATTSWVILASSNPLADGTGTAIKVDPGAAVRLQVLMPGESAAPGTANGRTGTPTGQTVGTAVPVTVRAVDANWNVVTSGSGSAATVAITSSDVNAVLPASAALVAGSGTWQVTFRTAGSRTVTGSASGLTAGTGSQVSVGAGIATSLQVLLPGETADPGSATGRTGAPSAQVAGTALTVTVRAVDTYFNLVATATGTITLSSTDTYATLPAADQLVSGARTFSLTFRTANPVSGWTIRATASSGTPALPFGTSAAARVNAGAVARLQLLVPGETAVPGSTTGRTGTPTSVTAGDVVEATVNAVDADWNVVATATPTVSISASTDPSAVLPESQALIAGTGTFEVTLVTAGGRTMTVTDTTSPGLTSATSATVVVAPADPDHLVVNAPSPVTVGVAFQLTVSVRDAWGNSVPLYGGTVHLTSSDGSATLPADATLTNGSRTFSATLRTAGTGATITATDADDSTITGSSGDITVQTAAAFNIALTLTATSVSVDPTSSSVVATATVTNNVGTGLTGRTVTISQTRGGTETQLTVSAPGAGQYQATVPASTVAGSTTISATDVTDGSIVATATLVYLPDTASQLQVLLPGEVAVPGSVSGKDSTGATPVGAGDTIAVTVNAVDAYWNVDTTVTHTVRVGALLSSGPDVTDSTATVPADASLIAGSRTFSVTLRRAGARIITATDRSAPALAAGGASTTVLTGAASRLQVLLPGETAAPGTASGKSGSPSTLTAGVEASVTVNAVDAWSNVVASATPAVQLAGLIGGNTESTAQMGAAQALASGTKAFPVTFRRMAVYTVTATDAAPGGLPVGTSASVLVDHGAFAAFQLLLPGQTTAPGTVSGVSGSASTITAGTAVSVRVLAVDAWWNLVDTVTAGVTFGSRILGSGDTTAALPADTLLVSGAATVLVTPRRATASTDWTITGAGGGRNGTSSAVRVNTGAATKLQVLLQGETAAPGTPTGRTGTPLDRTAGQAVDLTVNAVDDWWNVVSVARGLTFGVLSSTTGTGYVAGTGTVPAGAALVAGTYHTATGLAFTTAAFNELVVSAAAGSPNLTSATSAPVHVFAGTATHLHLSVTGSSEPVPATAGVARTVTVAAHDGYDNVATGYTGTFTFTSSDSAAVLPAAARTVVAGTGVAQFSVTLRTVGTRTIAGTGSQTLTVTDDDEAHTAVAHDDLDLAMSPGPAATITLALKQGGDVVTSIVADPDPVDPVTAVATVTDAFGNGVSGQTVAIAAIDGGDATIGTPAEDAAHPGQSVASYVANRLAHTETVRATDSSVTPNLVATITVVETPGAVVGYRLLLPGESAAPGENPADDPSPGDGRTGTPDDQDAGSAFTVRVDAVDEYWNVVDTLSTSGGAITMTTTATAGTAVLRSTIDLTNGTETLEVVLRKASPTGWTITAAGSSPSRTGTSSHVVVLAGSATKLQILLTGETAAPGTPIGRTGSPDDQAAGDPFTASVSAVDDWWNPTGTGSQELTFSAFYSADDTSFASETAGVTLPGFGSDPAAALDAGAYAPAGPNAALGTAGFHHLSVSAAGLTAGTSAVIHVQPGATAHLHLMPSRTSVVTGESFTVAIEAHDEHDNLTPAYAGTFELSLGEIDLLASLPTGSQTMVPGTGRRVFQVSLGTAWADQTIIATDTQASSITGTSAEIDVDSPTATYISVHLADNILVADPDCGTSDCQTSVTITVRSLLGLPVAGEHVQVATSGDATFDDASGTTNALGTWTTTLTASRTAGIETITATDTDTTPDLVTGTLLTEVAGPVAGYRILVPGETAHPGENPIDAETDPGDGKTGSPTTRTAAGLFTVRVDAVDEYWNVVTSEDITGIALSTTADDPVPTAVLRSTIDLASGTEQVEVIFRAASAGGWTITAESTEPALSGESSPIPVAAGTATKLQVLLAGEAAAPGTPIGRTGSPTNRTADEPTLVTVHAVDDWWNVVTSATHSLTFGARYSADDASFATETTGVTLPTGVSLAGGAYAPSSDNAGFTVAGYHEVTVSATGSPSLAAGTSSVLHVFAGEATHLEMRVGTESEPVATTAGASRVVTVGAYDDHENLDTTYTGSFTFDSSDAQATVPSGSRTPIPGTGVGRFTVVLRTAGEQTVTVSDAALEPQFEPDEAVLDWDVSASHGERITLALWQLGMPVTTVVADPDGPEIMLVATVADAFGNAVSDDDVRFDITHADGELSGEVTESPAGTYSQRFITGREADTDVVSVTDVTPDPDLTTSLTFVEQPGALAHYRILLPGEAADPGDLATGDGRTGTPSAQVAGTPFEITVDAVDEYWNVITSVDMASVALATSAPAGTWAMPATIALESGSVQVEVELRAATESGWTFGAQTADPAITGTTSPVTVVAGPAARLQVLLPGETAMPGTASGRVGSPMDQAAGATVSATVLATDAWWNQVSTANATVEVTTTDPGGHATSAIEALVNGAWMPSGEFHTAGSWVVAAVDVTSARPAGERLASGTSGLVTVVHGAFAKLQVLVIPDEAEAPGSDSGHTGTVVTRTAGEPVAIRVNAVDAYWNLVDDRTDSVTLSSGESTAVLPDPAALVGGTIELAVTFRQADASGWSLTAEGGGRTGTGSLIPVQAGPVVKLQVLLEGETAMPGTVSGTSGTPRVDIRSGEAFLVTVRAVDAYWNVVPSATPTVRIHAYEAGEDYDHAVLPDDTALVAGSWTFASSATKAGYPVYQAIDLAGTLSAGTSAEIDIDPGSAVRLQVLLPGQAPDPGTVDGVLGTPLDEPVGMPVVVVVRAVDAWWNVDDTATSTVQLVSATDSRATLPDDAVLVAGATTMLVDFGTAGTQTVTASVAGGGLTSATSAGVLVTGTSIQVEETIATGSGFPGQVVTSDLAGLDWQSTLSGGTLLVVLDADLVDGTGHAVDTADAELVDQAGTVIGTLDGARIVVTVPTFAEGQTSATGSTGFRIRVRIPSATSGSYSAALSYTVEAP